MAFVALASTVVWLIAGATPPAHPAEGKTASSRLPRVLVATALYGGAIATAYATRDLDVSRAIATGAGIVGGATLGVGLAGLAVRHGNWSASEGEGVGMMIIAGALLGGTLGGWALHAAAAPSDSRAPLTAAGLGLPYVLAIAWPVD